MNDEIEAETKAFWDGAASDWEFSYFDEPRVEPERFDLAESAQRLQKLRTRPMSVAFKLRKP